ncbi:MAG TPA: c-type cytochrome [Gammaproteobacteria bacterium]|nr:c-type cytochrome [Gammaproteobacteria bacterium]
MGILRTGIPAALLLLCSAPTTWAASSGGQDKHLVARGRYLVVIGGCNDCHTAGFAESGGQLPEKRWLTGNPLGWHGPWGTTYSSNLRRFMQSKTRAQWLEFAHNAKLRPPMPSWALHAMTDRDPAAIYAFIRHLGPAGKPAPTYVPPDQEPKGPYVSWPSPKAGRKDG